MRVLKPDMLRYYQLRWAAGQRKKPELFVAGVFDDDFKQLCLWLCHSPCLLGELACGVAGNRELQFLEGS